MKHKLWISTSIAALLLGGVASPITYADSQNESSPSTVQESTTNSEQQTATASSSTIESLLPSNQEETKNDEKDANSEESTPDGSTTISQVEEIAPVEEAIEESATTQGTWGTASYGFDASTGTLTVNNGTISSDLVDVELSAVKNIVFENRVVAPTKLMGVFTQFDNLISVSGDLDTSSVVDMSKAFSDLTNLTSLDVSNWDTSNVTNMSYLFYNASSLDDLNVSDWNTSNVTNMAETFKLTKSLTSLDINKWDTSNVTNMAGTFAFASSLKNLDVSDWNTSKVTGMSSLFDSAINLTSLNLGSWDTSNVINMSGTFSDAKSLTNLDINGWDTSKVKDVSVIFYGTDALSSITLGSKVNFSKTEDFIGLPDILTSPYEHSGKWVKTDGSNIYDSSSEFMEKYDGSIPGTYIWQNVVASSLEVIDIQIYKGDSWEASDGFVSGSYYLDPASEKVETKIDSLTPEISVIEDEKVDTSTPGIYHVTYKLGNLAKQTKITVLENQQSINGSDFTMTVGDSAPTVSDFKAIATDKDGKELDVSVDLSKADLTTAGTYDVELTTSDGQSKTVKLTVKEKVNQQSITGSDFTMTVGDSAPTVSDFQAAATDKDGKEIDVTVDFSKADLTTSGTYDVVLSTSDGQSKTVKLTVKDKVIADEEDGTTPSTGDKGSTSGTSTSVVNSSNSTIKTPSSDSYSSNSLPKTGDESSASSIVIGLGLVLISLLTLSFVRKRNK